MRKRWWKFHLNTMIQGQINLPKMIQIHSVESFVKIKKRKRKRRRKKEREEEGEEEEEEVEVEEEEEEKEEEKEGKKEAEEKEKEVKEEEEEGGKPGISLKSDGSIRGISSFRYSSQASFTLLLMGWRGSTRIRHSSRNCLSISNALLQNKE